MPLYDPALQPANNLDDVASPSAAFANISPLTAKGDLVYENGTPAPARLAVGSAGQVLGLSAGVPAWGMGLTLLAATAVGGYALVNGTGTVISWTAPSDGALHRVLFVLTLHVTSNETGGAISLTTVAPDGTSQTSTAFAAGLTSGIQKPSGVGNGAFAVEAGSTVTVTQSSLLSGGAAVLWAEIWGS